MAIPAAELGTPIANNAANPVSMADTMRAAMSGQTIPGMEELPDQEGESAYDVTPLPLDGSDMDDQEATPEGSPEGSTTETAAVESAKPKAVEPLIVRDADGRAFKLKVDLSKPGHVQRLAQGHYDAKRYKAQLDEQAPQLEAAAAFQAEHAEMKAAMEERGMQGLVDFLLDKPGAYEAHIEEERQRRNLLDSADPDERASALKLHEQNARERALAAREKKLAEQSAKSTEQLTKAEQAQHQSMFNSAWSKHELDGKLGDSQLEERLNKAAFNAVNQEVSEMQTKGKQLSQADYNRLIEREFSILTKGFKGAADKQAKQETQAAKAGASAALDARAGATPLASRGVQQDAVSKYAKGGSMIDLIKGMLGGR